MALIMGVTALGRTPHSVLEVPDTGEERSRRIFALMRRCRISIHPYVVQPQLSDLDECLHGSVSIDQALDLA